MSSTCATEQSKHPHLVPVSVAAKRAGYSVDYISRLAREGKIVGERVGRQWQVDLDSVKLYSLKAEHEKRKRQEKLRDERKHELTKLKQQITTEATNVSLIAQPQIALGQAAVLVCALALVLTLTWNVYDARLDMRALSLGAADIGVILKSIFAPRSDYDELVTTGNQIPTRMSETDAGVGLVVVSDEVPATEVAAIADSFSDQVTIDFDSESSGVIRPIFENASSSAAYRFLLVPINKSEQ